MPLPYLLTTFFIYDVATQRIILFTFSDHVLLIIFKLFQRESVHVCEWGKRSREREKES